MSDDRATRYSKNVKSVFNYDTVRWLEKHHKQKKVAVQNLDKNKLGQLREMFNHLDEDNSGSIDVVELQLAMEFLGLENEQETILEQFRYMDADESGSIDFEEFVTVMTSDIVDQEFFLLQDEKEAAKWNLAFFLFATKFRRQKLVDEIGDLDENTTNDAERYQGFHTLFSVPVLPSSLQDEDSKEAIMLELQRKKIARKQEIARSNLAASKILPKSAPQKKSTVLIQEYSIPSTHNRHVNKNSHKSLSTRSVRKETQIKRLARIDARNVLGTNTEIKSARLSITSNLFNKPTRPLSGSTFRKSTFVDSPRKFNI